MTGPKYVIVLPDHMPPELAEDVMEEFVRFLDGDRRVCVLTGGADVRVLP